VFVLAFINADVNLCVLLVNFALKIRLFSFSLAWMIIFLLWKHKCYSWNLKTFTFNQ
jgi:hypothetical protein